MAIGLVSDQDFEFHLLNSKNVKQIGVIEDAKHLGRGLNNLEVPENLRKIIGETTVIEGRKDGIELADQFGISKQSVDAYKYGATSLATYDKPNPGLLEYINNSKLKAGKKAQSRLLRALHHITDEKLEDAKPAELAVVAKAMSGIVKDMTTDSSSEEAKTGPTFVFYAPQATQERSFDVINVKE